MAKNDVLKNRADIKRYVKDLIKQGKDLHEIINIVKMRTSDEAGMDVDTIVELVEDTVNDYPNYELVQMIMKNKLVVDKDSKGETLYVVSKKEGVLTTFARSRLTDLFKKPDFSDSTYVAEFTYNPYQFDILYKKDAIWKFNTYVPPSWLGDYFMSGGKKAIEPVKLPPIYKDFLMHLVDKDVDSFNYVLDWTANAIKHRNFCILTTIGNQGIGKGVLGDIFQRLVGETNFTLTDNKLVQKDFNAQLKDKRIIYLDEILIKTSSELNKFKSLINTTVEVEQKGVDAVTIENFASIYTSSNDLDAINLPGDDRRFSIVNLTDKKLKDYFKYDIKELLSADNIEKLGRYLWNREVDEKKMLDVFISKRTAEIRAATLNSWQDYMLDVYCPKYAGRSVALTDVATDIREAADDYSFRLGRSAFQKLQNKYPHKFTITRPAAKLGKVRQYFISFSKEQK